MSCPTPTASSARSASPRCRTRRRWPWFCWMTAQTWSTRGRSAWTAHRGPIDPVAGALLLSLRVNFGDTADRIVLRGVALNLERAFDPIAKLRKKLKKHKHVYLTGRGTGHNNTEAKTTRPVRPVHH